MTWPVLTGLSVNQNDASFGFTGSEPVGIRAGAALVVKGFSPVEVLSVSTDGSKVCTLVEPWPYANVSSSNAFLIPLDGMLFEKVKELVQSILDVNTNFMNLLLSISQLATTANNVDIMGADGAIYSVAGWQSLGLKADKTYVNTELGKKLDKTGGTLTGDINVNGSTVWHAGNLTPQDFTKEKGASCGVGWVTILETTSSRAQGEAYIYDGESGDHSFMHLEWVHAYASASFSVLNVGGHAKRLTGARWIYESNDKTYGTWKLQVYSTVGSYYRTRLTNIGKIVTFAQVVTQVTPVLENLPSGYTEYNKLTNMNNAKGTMGTAGELVGGSGIRVGHGYNGTTQITFDGHTQKGYLQAVHSDNSYGSNGHYCFNLTSTDLPTSLSIDSNQVWHEGNDNYLLHADRDAANYGVGLTGSYSSVRFQQVFAMGAAYQMAEDGSSLSTGNTASDVDANFYGIGWVHNNNTDANARKITGHHAIFCSAGTTRSAIGDHIWTSGNITADKFYLGESLRTLSEVTGQLGTLQCNGSGESGWEGFSIDGRAVFMHDGNITTGLYDDVTDNWLVRCIHEGEVSLYYDGIAKLKTTSTGADVVGKLVADNLDMGTGNLECDTGKGIINSGAWTRLTTSHGYIELGPANSSYAHIYTDRSQFYLNKDILINGNKVWHHGNDAFLAAANGYLKLPNGLILQWGTGVFPNASWCPVSFPITFPNAVFHIDGSVEHGGNAGVNVIRAGYTTNSGFQHFVWSNPTGVKYTWFAIGW